MINMQVNFFLIINIFPIFSLYSIKSYDRVMIITPLLGSLQHTHNIDGNNSTKKWEIKIEKLYMLSELGNYYSEVDYDKMLIVINRAKNKKIAHKVLKIAQKLG